MTVRWQWERQSRSYGNYGNANQWTVNAGLTSLARETAQNSNDARVGAAPCELTYTFIRLTGERRAAFERALLWREREQLQPHLFAMAQAAAGAVSAGQIKSGLEALESSDALVLLRVSDSGTRGLTGPEFASDDITEDDFGNFIKLCRLDLFSGKDKASGGSFGLGKAVYWRFSRIQTVIFNSNLSASDAVGGRRDGRLFGVNQGVMHRTDDGSFQGRGYFGVDDDTDVESLWDDDERAAALYVARPRGVPGTTALIVGFYDPDRPDLGTGAGAELVDLARELRAGLEENFWPALTRNRMRARLQVIDDGNPLLDLVVDPSETFTELVTALRRYDAGDVDNALVTPGSVMVRDVAINVSARKDDTPHEAFVHTAKLIVTLSDDQPDSLENRVCLLRQPEMVVQTLDEPFEGRTYHAFLLAGVAVDPDHPTEDDLRADDFLRFAEPPAHDRWIPGTGRNQASQANLVAHYRAPWIPNLRKIATTIHLQLLELFGTEPVTEDKPPSAIFKHLGFLRGDTGGGGTGASTARKPELDIVAAEVVDDRWRVTFSIRAKNRPDGWSVKPALSFVGLDGRHVDVEWQSLVFDSGDGELGGDDVVLRGKPRGRVLKAMLTGLSTDDLPIPASESAIEVRAVHADVAPVAEEAVSP